jgi:ABC-2 type transport system ATP-binding protein
VSNQTPALVIDRLTKRYGNLTALDSLSITVDRGRILGLIGPNGSGKTTTIKMLVGLAKPSGGTAHIAGIDCARDSRKIKQMVGYMPDKFGAYDNIRVSEYLDFFGAAFGIGRRKRVKRIDEVLETTNATYMRDRYVESLSHGMQQRIGIARTLLHDPDVLIFDEPANGLDPQARIEMRELLLQLAASGKTLLVTSHILPELSRICDQVAILLNGKLRAFGSLPEIMASITQLRTFEIQLPGNDAIAAAGKIAREFASDESDAEVSESPAEAIIRLRTAKSDSELGELLRQLIMAGIAVNQFRELQADLEDAFLSITQMDENGTQVADASSIEKQTEVAQ